MRKLKLRGLGRKGIKLEKIGESEDVVEQKEDLTEKYLDPRYPLKRLLTECVEEGKDLILVGDRAIGKTYLVKEKMENNKNKKWVYSDKYLTNTELYKFMFKNRNKDFIVIDDASGFLGDRQRSTVMLKRAFGTKELGWSSSRIPEKMERFELKANIWLIANEIKSIFKTKNFKAVLSRAEYYELRLNKQERYWLFENKIMEEGEEELVKFIKKMGLFLDIRDFNRFRKIYHKREDWKDYIISHSVDNKREKLAIRLKLADIPKEKKKEVWRKRTGKSWRTWKRDVGRAIENEG